MTETLAFDVVSIDSTIEVSAGTVVMSSQQFDALTRSLGELLRWVTDAMSQLDYYRGAETVDVRPEEQ